MTSMDRLFDPGSSEEPQKACRKCGETKPLSEFYEQKGMKDGHRHNCKACHSAHHKEWYSKNRNEEIARVKKWQQENKDRVNASQQRRRAERGDEYKRKEREGHLLRKYGLRIRDFETLRTAQLGMCAICGVFGWDRLHVDHDHETGRVRGLLCGKCNKALGLLEDDPYLLRYAEFYLTRRGRRRPSMYRPPQYRQHPLRETDDAKRDDE